MSEEVNDAEVTAVVKRPEMTTAKRTDFTPEQVGLIQRQICAGASPDEFAMFLGQCRRTGLDPLAKQIYLVKRQGKMAIQVGIDGFRLIADRTGLYAGNDDPVFDNEHNPQKATVTVYKMIGGQRCAFTASARWAQYFPGDSQGFMWKKMPHLMLGKCAEGLALRKAFPMELSGLYIAEEMEQAGVPDAAPAATQAEGAAIITEKEAAALCEIVQKLLHASTPDKQAEWLGKWLTWIGAPYTGRPTLNDLASVPANRYAEALRDLQRREQDYDRKAASR